MHHFEIHVLIFEFSERTDSLQTPHGSVVDKNSGFYFLTSKKANLLTFDVCLNPSQPQ